MHEQWNKVVAETLRSNL